MKRLKPIHRILHPNFKPLPSKITIALIKRGWAVGRIMGVEIIEDETSKTDTKDSAGW